MLWLDLALRWLHILSAITLAGGAIFWRCALLPATQLQPDNIRLDVGSAIRSRWSKLVMASSGLLLVTGLINFFLILQRYDLDKVTFPSSKYHMFFGIKFLLSFGVFILSALLAGRTAAAEKVRRNERLWLNINLILVIAVVCLGGLLRAGARHPKATQSLRSDVQNERTDTDVRSSLTADSSRE